MTSKLFYRLWQDALEQPDLEMYIGEFGFPEYFDEVGDNVEEVAKILSSIHRVAHITIPEIISESSMTKREFSEKFCIPLKTIEGWAAKSGTYARKCPDWVRLMFCRELGILEVKK